MGKCSARAFSFLNSQKSSWREPLSLALDVRTINTFAAHGPFFKFWICTMQKTYCFEIIKTERNLQSGATMHVEICVPIGETQDAPFLSQLHQPPRIILFFRSMTTVQLRIVVLPFCFEVQMIFLVLGDLDQSSVLYVLVTSVHVFMESLADYQLFSQNLGLHWKTFFFIWKVLAGFVVEGRQSFNICLLMFSHFHLAVLEIFWKCQPNLSRVQKL